MYFKYLKDYVTLRDNYFTNEIVESQVLLHAKWVTKKKEIPKRLKRRNIFYLDINDP